MYSEIIQFYVAFWDFLLFLFQTTAGSWPTLSTFPQFRLHNLYSSY